MLRSHYGWGCEKNCGWRWRFEPLSFAYFSLRLQRKVGAAPHRGNASIPTRKEEKAKKPKKTDKKTPGEAKL
jgi:hypothetical protein